MKKSKRYLVIIAVVLAMVIFETIMYKFAAFFGNNPYKLSSSLDNKIPFVPEFIYAYIFWYVMIIVVPIIIYLKNKTSFYKYIVSLFILIVIGTVIFIAFPTTVARPNIEVNNITTWLVKFIYDIDTPILCCLPSMHCVLCFLMMFYTLQTKEFNIWYKIVITIMSLLIVLSTLFVKQHVIVDAVLALILTSVTMYVVNKFNLQYKLQKTIENKL